MFVPLIAGAAVGGLVMYLVKDNTARDKISGGFDSLKNKVSRKKAEQPEAEAETTETTEKEAA